MKRLRKRPKKEAVRIQLFPFMDVFLCMMGALILMFIIIANGSRGLVATAAREGAAKEDDLKVDRENAEWKIKHLHDSRDKTAADLEEKRLELGHLEEHASRVRDQLTEMDRAAAELARKATGGDPTADKLREQLADTKAQLMQARALLTEEDKKIKPQKDSFAIIPYEGPNQTRRRPIYIECRADGIFLQPEGVQLVPDDLSGVSGREGNPLASALRAAREYLVRNRVSNADDSGEPYPLILVRPDGIPNYYLAREAMQSWASDFGYELVERDWKIAYKTPDANLAKTLNRAVADARHRQITLALAAPALLTPEQMKKYRKALDAVARGENPYATMANSYGSSGGVDPMDAGRYGRARGRGGRNPYSNPGGGGAGTGDGPGGSPSDPNATAGGGAYGTPGTGAGAVGGRYAVANTGAPPGSVFGTNGSGYSSNLGGGSGPPATGGANPYVVAANNVYGPGGPAGGGGPGGGLSSPYAGGSNGVPGSGGAYGGPGGPGGPGAAGNGPGGTGPGANGQGGLGNGGGQGSGYGPGGVGQGTGTVGLAGGDGTPGSGSLAGAPSGQPGSGFVGDRYSGGNGGNDSAGNRYGPGGSAGQGNANGPGGFAGNSQQPGAPGSGSMGGGNPNGQPGNLGAGLGGGNGAPGSPGGNNPYLAAAGNSNGTGNGTGVGAGNGSGGTQGQGNGPGGVYPGGGYGPGNGGANAPPGSGPGGTGGQAGPYAPNGTTGAGGNGPAGAGPNANNPYLAAANPGNNPNNNRYGPAGTSGTPGGGPGGYDKGSYAAAGQGGGQAGGATDGSFDPNSGPALVDPTAVMANGGGTAGPAGAQGGAGNAAGGAATGNFQPGAASTSGYANSGTGSGAAGGSPGGSAASGATGGQGGTAGGAPDPSAVAGGPNQGGSNSAGGSSGGGAGGSQGGGSQGSGSQGGGTGANSMADNSAQSGNPGQSSSQPGGGGASSSMPFSMGAAGQPGQGGMPSPNLTYGQDNASSSAAPNQDGASPGAVAADSGPKNITPLGPLDSPGKSYASTQLQAAAGGATGYSYDDQRVDKDRDSSDDKKPRRKRHLTAEEEAARHNATPLSRSIHLQCYADRIIVVSNGDDKRGSRIILLNQHPQVVMHDLLGEVSKRVEGWGIAGRGMYWRPRLVLDVQPGADGRAAELQKVLAHGGMDAEFKARATGGAGPPLVGRKQ